MLILTCDACKHHIADDDAQAARRLPLGGELVDWCGACVGIVRAELPRVAAQVRGARRAGRTRPVHERARNLWDPSDTGHGRRLSR
jgi:hypothetical protein